MADLEEAKECYLNTLNHTAFCTSARISAGRRYLSLPALLEDSHQAHAMAKTTVGLIPLLILRLLYNTDKQY
jgi:hypothetical protein